MVKYESYKDLRSTLLDLKTQVIDSLDFADEFLPDDFEGPRDFFYWLKPQLHYKRDPKNEELLQTFQTLMKRNGQGDCDCFTIASLAACEILGYGPLYVNLVGKTNLIPTHIYIEVFDPTKDKIKVMDFTNPYYNMERTYKFKQRLLFRI